MIFEGTKKSIFFWKGKIMGRNRTGNYDVAVSEQEYLEMINHWEMVYGKGMENDRKQL